MKMTAFWDIAPCSFVKVGRRFRGDDRPVNGGSKHLSNVGKLLRHYTEQYPVRVFIFSCVNYFFMELMPSAAHNIHDRSKFGAETFSHR
jgi:hypothetical protein